MQIVLRQFIMVCRGKIYLQDLIDHSFIFTGFQPKENRRFLSTDDLKEDALDEFHEAEEPLSNIVLSLTTFHTGKETVNRFRPGPPKTSTNARTSRGVFGYVTVKELPFPQFIDMYNYFMNGVDLADQLRSY